MNKEYWPGTKVFGFDNSLYKNDLLTPLNITMKIGIVIKWYGTISEYMEREHGRENALYPSLVDIEWQHSGKISHGHFTERLRIL